MNAEILRSDAGFRDGFRGAWYVSLSVENGQHVVCEYSDGHTCSNITPYPDFATASDAFDKAVITFQNQRSY